MDIKSKSYTYKRLLSGQYSYINIPKNRMKILDKAKRLYNIFVKSQENKMSKFYKDLSCDFSYYRRNALNIRFKE